MGEGNVKLLLNRYNISVIHNESVLEMCSITTSHLQLTILLSGLHLKSGKRVDLLLSTLTTIKKINPFPSKEIKKDLM